MYFLTLIGCWQESIPILVLIGIKFLFTGHGNADRIERVEDLDGVFVMRQYFRQPFVTMRRFIRSRPAQLNALLVDPIHHHRPRNRTARPPAVAPPLRPARSLRP